MDKKNYTKKDIEFFYVLPYIESYNSGGYYRSDETCSINYKAPSLNHINSIPLVFDDKEELLNYFLSHPGNPTPPVYRIKYINNYLGIDDVIKITNLNDNTTGYYTALNMDAYAKYDEVKSKMSNKNIWEYCYSYRYDDKALFNFEKIYNELIKRKAPIKYNVYKKNTDINKRFEYIGDPFYEKENIKEKKLILYKPNLLKSCW